MLINIWPPPATVKVVNLYRRTFMGQQTRRDYRVINLWEVNAELAFQPSLRALLPFVPALQGGSEPAVIWRALNRLRDDAELHDLETLLGFLAGFVLDINLIVQNMRIDMAVLRTSPWYQEAIEEGRLLERRESREEMLTLMLQERFGELSTEIKECLRALNPDQIKALVKLALQSDSLAAFVAHLSTVKGQDTEEGAEAENDG